MNTNDWEKELGSMIKAHYAGFRTDDGKYLKEFNEDIYNTKELIFFIKDLLKEAIDEAWWTSGYDNSDGGTNIDEERKGGIYRKYGI